MTGTAAGDVVRAATPFESTLGAGAPLLEARLFGPLAITIDGRAVDLSCRGRVRRLLAYLLAHRRPVPTVELQRRLWPGSSDRAARNCLHVTVSQARVVLRHVCAFPVVVFRQGTYELSPSIRCETDLESFDRFATAGLARATSSARRAVDELQAALDCSAQTFLTDDRDLPWVIERRSALVTCRIEVRLTLGEILVHRGSSAGAGQLAAEVLADDACNERAHRLAMTAYAARGDRVRAIEQFARCRSALVAAHRLDPAPATITLYEAFAGPPTLFDA